jgi:hypothetical protein
MEQEITRSQKLVYVLSNSNNDNKMQKNVDQGKMCMCFLEIEFCNKHEKQKNTTL